MGLDLIYDIGMHNGDDTAFYLAKAFKVVAVEANPALVEGCRARFVEQIACGQLVILQKAISDQPGHVTLYVNPRHTYWSSIYQDIAARDGGAVHEVHAQTITMADLFNEYGVPYYLKIDIEKADRAALLQ